MSCCLPRKNGPVYGDAVRIQLSPLRRKAGVRSIIADVLRETLNTAKERKPQINTVLDRCQEALVHRVTPLLAQRGMVRFLHGGPYEFALDAGLLRSKYLTFNFNLMSQ